MKLETVRAICRALAGVTEDIKWGDDLAFSVGRKMFALIDLRPPHPLAFKCSADTFSELTEREGIVPAPYLARAMWVQEQELGQALDRRELEALLAAAYREVVAKLPRSRRPRTLRTRARGPASGRPSRHGRAPGRRPRR